MAWLPVCSGIGAEASPRQHRWVAIDTSDGFGALAGNPANAAGSCGSRKAGPYRSCRVLMAQPLDGAAAAAPARPPRQGSRHVPLAHAVAAGALGEINMDMIL